MTNQEIVNELAKLNPCSMFLSLKKYRSENSELANHTICFHISYENALIKSLESVKSYQPASELEIQAKQEVLDGYQKSLDKIKIISIEEIDDAYDRFFNANGEYIKGIKVHRESQNLHIYGLAAIKEVLIPGDYPKTNKKPLTIAKDKLRKLGAVSRFRQFKINSNNIEQVNVGKLELIIGDL